MSARSPATTAPSHRWTSLPPPAVPPSHRRRRLSAMRCRHRCRRSHRSKISSARRRFVRIEFYAKGPRLRYWLLFLRKSSALFIDGRRIVRMRNRRRRDVPSPHPWLMQRQKDGCAGDEVTSGEKPFPLSPCHGFSPEPPSSRRGTPPVAGAAEGLRATRTLRTIERRPCSLAVDARR